MVETPDSGCVNLVMNRRNFIQATVAGVVGQSHARQDDNVVVKAGAFAVTIPAIWQKSAIIEKVPIKPLYSKEDWKAYQADKHRILKPSYGCRPQHWALRFPAAVPKGITFDQENAGENPEAPQILMHKAEEWGMAFTDGIHTKDKAGELRQRLRREMDEVLQNDNPHVSPAFMDASLTFMCLKRRIDFTGGHGVRLVAQWTIEAELMRLGGLHYLFLGMSVDSTCQIIATFPLGLPGLPTSEGREHLGWSMERYGELEKGFNRYEADAIGWLGKHEQEITPSLRTLDAMMQSLVASSWKQE